MFIFGDEGLIIIVNNIPVISIERPICDNPNTFLSIIISRIKIIGDAITNGNRAFSTSYQRYNLTAKMYNPI